MLPRHAIQTATSRPILDDGEKRNHPLTNTITVYSLAHLIIALRFEYLC